MSGDWIKMRADLHTHPKIVRIASALQADRLRVVGALHAVWCLFDIHSVDGSLSGYTADAVDELIGFAGFAGAMAGVHWLEIDEDGLLLPEFEEHNGQSAKRRAMEAQRKRREREEAQAEADRIASASDADKKRTREEKRREEKKNTPPPPKGGFEIPDWVPAKPWADFVAMRRAKGNKVPFTVAAAKGIVAKLETFRAAGHDIGLVLEESVINGWSGVFEPKTRQQGRGGSGPGDWTGAAT